MSAELAGVITALTHNICQLNELLYLHVDCLKHQAFQLKLCKPSAMHATINDLADDRLTVPACTGRHTVSCMQHLKTDVCSTSRQKRLSSAAVAWRHSNGCHVHHCQISCVYKACLHRLPCNLAAKRSSCMLLCSNQHSLV